MNERKIELEYGMNHVVYTDSRDEVDKDTQLYYNGRRIGTLNQLQNNIDTLGTMNINDIYTGKKIGDVIQLKHALTTGGKRKSRRNQKSKKSRKSNRR